MELFIFDIDGTITNTLNIDDKCFRDTLESEFGICVKDELWEFSKKLTSGTDSGIFNYLFKKHKFRNPSDGEIKLMKDSFHKRLMDIYENNPEYFQEISGAKEYLNSVTNNPEIFICFATGSWRHSAEIKLNAIGIEYQNYILSCSDDCLFRNDIVRNALDETQKKVGNKIFKSVTYFGDGIWDFTVATELGYNFIGIDFNGNGFLKKIGVEYVYRNFIELLDKK